MREDMCRLAPCPQARRLEIRLRTPKGPGGEAPPKAYVHMLNGTLSATEPLVVLRAM